MNKKWMRRIPVAIGIGLVAVTAFSGAVMLLWNGVLAPVLHVGAVSFWQAAGILVLSKILFGGFRGRPAFAAHSWKRRMMMKWQNMTPEQREEWTGRMQGCHRPFGNRKEAAVNAA